MTKAEAIKDLQFMRNAIERGDWIYSNDNRALDMAIEALSAQEEPYLWQKEMVKILSAQPDIVRCKDCTRYEKKRGCNLVEGLNIATENCFCSYAERKDNG